MKTAYIDFEFNKPAETYMGLVCAVLYKEEKTERYWLKDHPEVATQLVHDLIAIKDTHILVGFSIAAEARCLLALGIAPLDFKWIDIRVAFMMLVNGTFRKMSPELKSSLLNVKRICGIVPSDLTADLLDPGSEKNYKDRMRDKIIHLYDYDIKDQVEILDYCQSDVRDLPTIAAHLFTRLSETYAWSMKEVVTILQYHSKYVVAMGQVEHNGIPLHMERLNNLANNSVKAVTDVMAHCNETYPFFETGVRKYEAFERFITEKGLADMWPRSEKTQKFSSKSETLEKFFYVKEIQELSKAIEMKKYLSWFRPKGTTVLLERVGSDHRLRPDYGVFGTVTSRNTPPAKTFIFAMASWLRSLVDPIANTFITEIDYKNQEFIIAAQISGCEAMKQSYYSGDIYVAFAKLIGTIPPEGTEKTHPTERKYAKSTVLGIQFGMGKAKLAHKLSVETGEEVSEKEALQYIEMHRSAYPEYWKWVKLQENELATSKFFTLPDYWPIQVTDQNKRGTYLNFPIQGAGQSIIHSATRKAVQAGLKVIANVHDSILIEHSSMDDIKKLDTIMDETAKKILGCEILREIKTYKPGDLWITKKGKEGYDLLGKYLQKIEGGEDAA